MNIKLNMVPPTTTAQQKGEQIIYPKGTIKTPRGTMIPLGKKPFVNHYKKRELESIEVEYKRQLRPWRIENPMEGPVKVVVVFVWPYRTSERKSIVNTGELILKDTKPDWDNAAKLLMDCLEKCGFFYNDSQIADPRLLKFWGPNPFVGITIKPASIDEEIESLVKPFIEMDDH